MFEKMMGNVFRNYGQCFPKLSAMFFATMGNTMQAYGQHFFSIPTTVYSIGKGIVETCLKPETGLRDIA